ncbi:uncharacterized protein [Henckelia pumila]|uniref:uncharacterized protein n=1 Tax=Henckelia pumila TaxID=405737 RepID=UPI003C6E0FFC
MDDLYKYFSDPAPWIPSIPTHKCCLNSVSDVTLKVVNLITLEGEWNDLVVKQLFTKYEAEAILDVPLNHREEMISDFGAKLLHLYQSVLKEHDITMDIPYSGTAQRPPILDGSNYSIWKVRMRVYIKSIDEKAWQRVLQGWNPPRRTYGEGDFLLKPETEWNADETAASNMNNKALNAIFTSLDSNMFSLVTNCVCAKQAWKKLQMHCKGSDSVRRTKRRILTTQFENLRMEESETIDEYERRLRKIENEAIDLGDAISNKHLVRKVLRSLPERFQMKICAIDESKDTSILGLDELMSSLQTYELEMNFGKRDKGVTTLGHNTDQKVLCLNASVSEDSNQEAGEVELSWDNAQKMYEELYNDWILRNKSNSALTKENSELKASVARLEVVLSKKDLELGKVKKELGRANATLAKFNSSKTKLDSILMMRKDDRASLGFHNSKFEVGESSQTIFVKENSNSASVPIAIPKEKPIPLKAQALVQRKKQRKRRFVCHYCHKQGHIKPYCFKLRYDYMYWNSRQELSSVLPTLNQNTARKKNFEKKVWVPKAKSSCNVVYTSLKTNVAGHWYFDSGSSRHMTGLKKYLSDYVEQDKGKVTYRRGANGKIVGKGTLNVEGMPKLHNVLHVKGLNANLISISQLCDDDIYVKFDKNLCQLGHANFKALKKLSQYDAVRGMPNLTSGVPYVCGDCKKGKQTRVSHPVLQHSGTTRCLEFLHMDLMGPMEVESCGDLKGKTIEDNIDDLLDTVAPQTDSSVVNSVVPPEKSPSTKLSPTLNMNEHSTEDQDDFENEIQDSGHNVPSKIQKNHPTSQIIGDAQGRMQTQRKEKE